MDDFAAILNTNALGSRKNLKVLRFEYNYFRGSKAVLIPDGVNILLGIGFPDSLSNADEAIEG
jgi:hypothetical protein